MTPATILAGIPDGLLRRRANPDAQLENAKALAVWLLERGHRPTWAEIEQERARRTFTNERTHRRVIRRSTQPKEN